MGNSNFKYNVVFYPSCDDGSHPYGDFKLMHDTPEAAWAYGEAEVEREWQENRDNCADKVWFDKAVERNIFVVEVRKI